MCGPNKTNALWSQICHALPIALLIAPVIALRIASAIALLNALPIALVIASVFVPVERVHLLQTKAL